MFEYKVLLHRHNRAGRRKTFCNKYFGIVCLEGMNVLNHFLSKCSVWLVIIVVGGDIFLDIALRFYTRLFTSYCWIGCSVVGDGQRI
jgi:hypothetical protein